MVWLFRPWAFAGRGMDQPRPRTPRAGLAQPWGFFLSGAGGKFQIPNSWFWKVSNVKCNRLLPWRRTHTRAEALATSQFHRWSPICWCFLDMLMFFNCKYVDIANMLILQICWYFISFWYLLIFWYSLLIWHMQWSANSRLRWATTLILHILTYALVIITAPLSLFFVLRKVRERCQNGLLICIVA